MLDADWVESLSFAVLLDTPFSLRNAADCRMLATRLELIVIPAIQQYNGVVSVGGSEVEKRQAMENLAFKVKLIHVVGKNESVDEDDEDAGDVEDL